MRKGEREKTRERVGEREREREGVCERRRERARVLRGRKEEGRRARALAVYKSLLTYKRDLYTSKETCIPQYGDV